MSQYLGDISAYALAVSQGYTGTEEEYAELMASYATVGQTAVTAAQTATTKASEAATSATTATNKATEATTAATTATNKAAEAQADADAAALDASQALSAASTATTKATEATTAAATATSAKTDAVAANTAAQSAKTAAQTAQTGAETAAASVEASAEQIATNAEDISQLKSEFTALAPKEDMLKAFPTDTASGSVASLADGANVPVKSLVVNIDPVQSGSGDPSPTNVRPISGWSEVNVQKTGKNLLDVTQFTKLSATTINSVDESTGTITFTVTAILYGLRTNISVEKYAGKTVYFSAIWPNNPQRVEIKNLDANGTAIGNAIVLNTNSSIIIPQNAVTLEITLSNASVVSTPITFRNLMLEVDTTATDFEPYSGQSINIVLGQTVYGGTLDVTKGELVIDRAMVTINGTESFINQNTFTNTKQWSTIVSGITNMTGIFATDVMCDMLKTIGDQSDVLHVNHRNDAIHFWIPFDVTPQTYFATNNANVVYPLATPITVQLTPHEVTALLGSNNVWSDTGDSTVEYRADPTLYIGRLTEPDADMVADSNITSGQYFMVGNTLYKATANIASGANISPNVNCTRKSLSEALNELNA